MINLIKRGEIKENNQSEKGNKRRDKKNENKKNDSNEDKKCIRCDRGTHSKNECPTINSECFECHKTGH